MTSVFHTCRRLTAYRAPLSAALGLAFVTVLFAYPLARFLLLPFFPSLAPLMISTMSDAAASLSWLAIWNSIRIGTEAAICVLPFGLGFGLLLERYQWKGQRLVAGAIWLLFLTPSYLMANGWQILFATPALHGGALSRMFHSEGGIVALSVLKALPFACFAARAGWAGIGGEISAALRIHVRRQPRRWWIILRLMLPAIGAILAVVFVEVIQDFGIAATLAAQLHMPLVIFAIYQKLSQTPVDFIQASVLSWQLVMLAGLSVWLHHWMSRRESGLIHGRRQSQRPARLNKRMRCVATLATLLLIIAGFGVPMLALVMEVLVPQDTVSGAASLSQDDWASLANSSFYAGFSATLALGTACMLAVNINRGKKSRAGFTRVCGQAVNLVVQANMAVPGLVLGAAFLIAFNTAWLPLYGTPMLLVIAYTAGHLPPLMRYLRAPLSQLSEGLTDAARLHGLGPLTRLEKIHVPLLLRPLIWAWVMSFGSMFFELPMSELLYPAARTPTSVQLIGLEETLHYAAEARLALVAIAICLSVAAFMTLVLPRLITPDAPKGKKALKIARAMPRPVTGIFG